MERLGVVAYLEVAALLGVVAYLEVVVNLLEQTYSPLSGRLTAPVHWVQVRVRRAPPHSYPVAEEREIKQQSTEVR